MLKYNSLYSSLDSFWGDVPSKCAYEILKCFTPDSAKKILDLGSGEGRNSLLFARNGFKVTAVDVSNVGIEKIRGKIKNTNLEINTIVADISEMEINNDYDVIFSMGVLHYIQREKRDKVFQMLKQHTKIGGYNSISVFVKKPYNKELRSESEIENLFYSGELMRYYADWKILYFEEKEKQCNSNNVKHTHIKNTILAQRVS